MHPNERTYLTLTGRPVQRSARRISRSAILFATCLAVFLAQLDTSIVNLALKQIGGDLHAGINQLQWVIDAYNLAYAGFLLTGGTLGDAYGRRRIFLVGIALFTGGSLLGGLAPDAATLIAGRALTGLGAAFAVPVSLAILSDTFSDPTERARAIGVWAGCNGLAWLVGPTAGGVAVAYAGWRSLFLLIVPIGLTGGMLAWHCIPASRAAVSRGLDLPGQALAIVMLGAFALGSIEGPHWGWHSTRTIGCLSLAALSLLVFLLAEWRTRKPLLPLGIFKTMSFSSAAAVAAAMTFGMYALLFLLPLYLQAVRGATASVAGFEMLPMALAFAIVSHKSGDLAARFGARTMMAAGTFCMGGGLAVLAATTLQTELVEILAALLLIGVGLGLNTGPVLSVAVASAPKSYSGAAASVVNTARMVGATLGVAVLGSLFATQAGQSAADPQGIVNGLHPALMGGAISEFLGTLIALLFIPRDALKKHAVGTGSAARMLGHAPGSR